MPKSLASERKNSGREREREEVCSWTDWEAGKLRGQELGRSPGKEIKGASDKAVHDLNSPL